MLSIVSINDHKPKSLHSKECLDRIEKVNEEATEQTVASNENSDIGVSDKGLVTNPILSNAPNSYKQRGAFVSKIPYYFETPIPSFFREQGWFKNINTWKFINWCFSRCYYQSRNVVHDGKNIFLLPFMFIFGRETCAYECDMTEDEVRTQAKKMEKNGFLKKCPNNTPNRFTLYIWEISNFPTNPQQTPNKSPTTSPTKPPTKYETKPSKNPQQNPQQIPNKPPTNPHNLDNRLEIYKEDLSSNEEIDDFSSKIEIQENILVFESSKFEGENLHDVYLSREDLEDCIKIHGDIFNVCKSIYQLQTWEGRKYKIKNWRDPIKKWKLRKDILDLDKKHEEIGRILEEKYKGSENKIGWSLRIYRDRKKDQKGILFEGRAELSVPVFIPFGIIDFDKKVNSFMNEKGFTKW